MHRQTNTHTNRTHRKAELLLQSAKYIWSA